MNCRTVDGLAAPFALGAVDASERRAIVEHLATCPEPHGEAREAIGADVAMAVSVDPVTPSSGLRDRLMATIATTRQEPLDQPASEPRSGWQGWRWARPLTIGSLAASLLLAVLVGGLWAQLQDREARLQETASALAAGEVAYRVDGSVGSGYVVETPGDGATLILAGVDDPPSGSLYELWLIDAAGTPTAVGTFASGGEDLTLVPVERDLSGFDTFAVTVERERVAAPSGAPVLAAPLGG